MVSEMCLGTMTFGLQADKKTAFRVMDRSIEAGIKIGIARMTTPGCIVSKDLL